MKEFTLAIGQALRLHNEQFGTDGQTGAARNMDVAPIWINEKDQVVQSRIDDSGEFGNFIAIAPGQSLLTVTITNVAGQQITDEAMLIVSPPPVRDTVRTELFEVTA